MKNKIYIFLLSFVFFSISSIHAEKYELDRAHSKVEFEIPHLMISSVTGRFSDFEAIFDYNSNNNQITDILADIKTESINTENEKRDKHLKSPDFFESKKYPFIKFKSSKVIYSGGKPVKIIGMLSIRNITKKVELDFVFKGTAKDPWGSEFIVFEARTVINRKDFGLLWNKNLDEGGVMIGDVVQVLIKGEGKKKQ